MAEQKLYKLLSGLVEDTAKTYQALSGAYVSSSDLQSLKARVDVYLNNMNNPPAQ